MRQQNAARLLHDLRSTKMPYGHMVYGIGYMVYGIWYMLPFLFVSSFRACRQEQDIEQFFFFAFCRARRLDDQITHVLATCFIDADGYCVLEHQISGRVNNHEHHEFSFIGLAEIAKQFLTMGGALASARLEIFQHDNASITSVALNGVLETMDVWPNVYKRVSKPKENNGHLDLLGEKRTAKPRRKTAGVKLVMPSLAKGATRVKEHEFEEGSEDDLEFDLNPPNMKKPRSGPQVLRAIMR